jgi:hypothetical protein
VVAGEAAVMGGGFGSARYDDSMPYRLRRTWPDNPGKEDYIIRCEGLDVGRVYLTKLPDGERFVWTIYINGHVPVVRDVPISGMAATLGLAGADFKRAMSGCARQPGCRSHKAATGELEPQALARERHAERQAAAHARRRPGVHVGDQGRP